MRYQKRADGLIAVKIDSNVWNLLFDQGLILAQELPPERFKIFIPRQVEIEIEALKKRPDKANLLGYIRTQIAECSIKTTAVFGFSREDGGPERFGGFGWGAWQSEDERAFYDLVRDQYLLGKSVKKSLLNNNEADAALGAASFSSVVLTLDVNKNGPLKIALEHGGKILDMRAFIGSGLSLAEYVTACHEAS